MLTWSLTDNNTGQTEVMKSDPKGWQETVLKHERDPKFHGVSYDFTSEFGFFCKGGGKELVDNAYKLRGQEGDVTLTMHVKCNGKKTKLFTGKLNLKSYRQEWESNVLYSYVDVEKDDIKKLINVREDIKVNLLSNQSLGGVPLLSYPYAGYQIQMHSKVVQLISQWENAATTVGCNGFENDSIFDIRIAEWAKIAGELKDSSDVPASFEGTFGTGTAIQPIVEFSNDYIYPLDATFAWDVSGTFYDKSFLAVPGNCGTGTPSGISRGTVGIDITLSLFKGSDPNDLVNNTTRWNLVTIPAYNRLSATVAEPFGQSGSISIQVDRGEKLWLFWVFAYRALVGGIPHDIEFTFDYTTADFTLTADTTTPATEATGIAIHEAWSRMSSILTDQTDAFRSDFFGRTNSNVPYPTDGCGSRTAITSGLNIRGFDNSAITISLKDFFESCFAVWGTGLGIENNIIRVEPVYYFYQPVVVLDLPNVPNINMTHLPEIVYNSVKLSFAKWQTEGKNGLDEPLSSIEYAVRQVKSHKNEFRATSAVIGGMYAIEFTRRKNSVDFATEDTAFDENCFFVCLSKTDLTIPEKDENFSTVTGLISPETAYNLRLMLSSTFDRLKYLITSGLTKLAAIAPVNFPVTNTEGNASVTYAYVPDGCDGDHFGSTKLNGADQVFPDSTARRELPLFLPEQYTFEYPLSFADYLKFIGNPYGLVRFTDGKGKFYFGWVTSLEYNVAQKSASFTLIRKYG